MKKFYNCDTFLLFASVFYSPINQLSELLLETCLRMRMMIVTVVWGTGVSSYRESWRRWDWSRELINPSLSSVFSIIIIIILFIADLLRDWRPCRGGTTLQIWHSTEKQSRWPNFTGERILSSFSCQVSSPGLEKSFSVVTYNILADCHMEPDWWELYLCQRYVASLLIRVLLCTGPISRLLLDPGCVVLDSAEDF